MAKDIKELQKLRDKTFILHLNILSSEVNKQYQKILVQAQSTFETKGFRKGKVPLEIVKTNLNQEKTIEEILSTILRQLYHQKVSQYQLHPIISPQIKIINPPLDLTKDWQIELTSCEKPKVSLDSQYLSDIKKVNSSKPKDLINEIFNTLVKHSTIKFPPILIKSELNQRLGQLLDHLRQARVSVDQFLQSQKTDFEKYQQQISNQIISEWTLNLTMDHLATTQKISVEPPEVESYLKTHPEAQNQRHLVSYVILQDKIINYLKNL